MLITSLDYELVIEPSSTPEQAVYGQRGLVLTRQNEVISLLVLIRQTE